jgi:g-D-glutamyl-meso-diaminopimelate peptidase
LTKNQEKLIFLCFEGKKPESAAESKALANYVRNNPIDITLSYHTMGSVIYWDFPNQDKMNELNLSLSSKIVPESGFRLLSDPYTCAGFRDWAILQGIPSLTVELGVGKVPSIFDEFFQIWCRSKNVIYETALWALENETELPNYNKSK